jgi:hypothetical protein
MQQQINYITLVSNVSKRFTIGDHDYYCRKLNDKFLFNDLGIYQKGDILWAQTERAIADLLYFNPKIYLDTWNTGLIDWKKVKKIQQNIGYQARNSFSFENYNS